jgi:hypothetical protein
MRMVMVGVLGAITIFGCKNNGATETAASSAPATPASSGVSPIAVAPAVASPAPSSAPSAETAPAAAPASICADLDHWLPILIDYGKQVEDVQVKYRSRNKLVHGTNPMDLLDVAKGMAKRTSGSAETMRIIQKRLHALTVPPAEQSIQSDIGKGYDATATAFEKYTELFKRVPSSMGDIVGLNQTVEHFSGVSMKLDKEVRASCAKLGASGGR